MSKEWDSINKIPDNNIKYRVKTPVAQDFSCAAKEDGSIYLACPRCRKSEAVNDIKPFEHNVGCPDTGFY